MPSSREQNPLKVAVAAGGTGGHIAPALALGEALANIGHDTVVDYFCGNRPIELEFYKSAGVEPKVLPVGSITQGGALKRAAQTVGLGLGFARSLVSVRGYDVAVGMGGYASGPVLSAALTCRVPIVLHESNTVLGRVNRLMASKAKFVGCGMPIIDPPEDVPADRFVEIGTPVRLGIAHGNREKAAPSMYLRPDVFTLFVLGGSQGSNALNNLAAAALGELSKTWPADAPMQVIWSTGERNFETVRESLKEQPIRGQIFLAPVIENMENAYALSDLVIGRAGASSLAEILMCGLPSILVPLPTAVGNHQYYNALVLERQKAAAILPEEGATGGDLARLVLDIALDRDRIESMSAAALRLACPDAARDLAHLVVEAARPSED